MANWNKQFPKAKANQTVDYLIDGAQYYNALITDFSNLQKDDSLLIMGWMFDTRMEMIANNKSSTPLNYLIAAKNLGVNVAVMIWDNPLYHGTNATALADLQAAKIEVQLESSRFATSAATQTFLQQAAATILNVYKAHALLKGSALFSIFQAVLDPLRKIEQHIAYFSRKAVSGQPLSVCAYHDKVTVIVKAKEQEVIAYCGGIDYNPNRLDNSMHDVQCRVVGPAANSIYSKVVSKWNEYPQKGKSSIAQVVFLAKAITTTPPVYALAVGTENYSTPVSDFHRTFSDAYLKIIDHAEQYIYIEDQYLVSAEVADRLSARMKANPKLFVIIMFQNDTLTNGDMFIGARIREDVIRRLYSIPKAQHGQIHLYTLNNSTVKSIPEGLHSKVLIVDDEIAIIGSGNVNRRSFTHDSETSLVVFDDNYLVNKFAKNLRIAIWTKYAGGAIPASLMQTWQGMFGAAIGLPSMAQSPVMNYKPDTSLDMDVKIQQLLQTKPILYAKAIPGIGSLISALSQLTTPLFNGVFDHLVDPKA